MIINTPIGLVQQMLDLIVSQICNLLEQSAFKARASLIETLIELVQHMKEKILGHSDQIITTFLQQLNSDDTNAVKAALDAL